MSLVLASPQEEVVFRSDVSLVRVDAQVVDARNSAITHLRPEDFILREEGRTVPIRNFESENMPVDVLFLLDVSASMRPHVQRIADASGQALTVLGKDDRMGIMVFDRSTRVRLPFRSNRQDVQREFDRLLRDERFNGGTDITRAMLDAADYIRREGRRNARRAIVILTDDQTEFDRNEAAVSRALTRADTVMCALIAPDAMQSRQYPGGGQRRGGWGGGPGIGTGGPLGGIIFGPRRGGPYGGNRSPGRGGMGGPQTKSAGTAEIARDSGGDSMSVDDASALEETLSRIRQRYALYFNLPEGVKPGQERNIEVDLASAARRRFPDAEVRYRRVYLTPEGGSNAAPIMVTRAPTGRSYSTPSAESAGSEAPPVRRRRLPVNEDGSAIGGSPQDSPILGPAQPSAQPGEQTAPDGKSAPAAKSITGDPKSTTPAPNSRAVDQKDKQ
ncbi:MAG TPA: VWA domain-containing protein [Bryobacteraceae bacterium]|nr:VWA domain-containing protein [Bryobacteraceae bacterium]